ncbi:MAG: hypothetical protein J2O39_07530, partial [Acidimicrobiales bacterium]|nr:hypothetical protein [Acidimicrobiales bacterium]
MTGEDHSRAGFGPNAWLVEEMYERYLSDPGSVGEDWRELFGGYQPPGVSVNGAGGVPARPVPGVAGANRPETATKARPERPPASSTTAPDGL